MKSVAAYCRFSTDKQDQRSIADQTRRIERFAAQRGCEVVERYADEAMSGTNTDRPDLRRLLVDARRRKFESVLVDDLSRLSRDLGDTWNIIFRDLRSAGVNVIDCQNGLASDARGARITYGAQALVNDFFVEMIRDETHRGLEGRALAGFSAGGKTYGFATVIEPSPPDPMHPRKVRVICEDEAAVVVRIFEMYADGLATKQIAKRLNAEGIRAPHDGGKGNKVSRGWGHTTVRYILRNENYIGRWVWNRHRFIQIRRDDGSVGNRHAPRPESEWVRTEAPELRIIDADLWANVRERIGVKRAPRLNRLGTGTKAGSMLAGVAKCGVCGGAIGLVSRRYHEVNGARVGYAMLGCGIHASRGATICPNGRTISAKKLTDIVVATLRDPTLRGRIADAVKRRLTEPKKSTDLVTLEKQIAGAETRVKNATEALVAMGYSAAMVEAVKAEEAKLGALRNAYAAASAPKAGKVALHPTMINRMMEELAACMESDPAGARTVLRFMPTIYVTPEGYESGARGGPTLVEGVPTSGQGVHTSGQGGPTLASGVHTSKPTRTRLRISGGFDIDALVEPDTLRGSTCRRDRLLPEPRSRNLISFERWAA